MIEPVARAAMLAAMLQAGHPQRWRFCAEPLEEGSALARIAAYDEAGSFAGYL